MKKFNPISECPVEQGIFFVLAVVLTLHVLLMSSGILADLIDKVSG